MEPRKPSGSKVPTNSLAPNHEHDKEEVIHGEYSAEHPRYDSGVAVLQDPVKHAIPKPETDRLLPHVHRDEHLRRVRMVRIHGVGQGEAEIEIATEDREARAKEVSDPVEVKLCDKPVDNESYRSDHHTRKHHTQTHFRFPDATVAHSQIGRKLVR